MSAYPHFPGLMREIMNRYSNDRFRPKEVIPYESQSFRGYWGKDHDLTQQASS